MFVRRLAVAGLIAAGTVSALPAPVLAHGAPVTPISRSAACAGNGTERGEAACTAALQATGGFLGAYDNIRLANVGGRDRERVPDGKLCSAGLRAYRGLDLARDDFPATRVRAGQRLALSYRGTIPHQGVFRIYLTRPGYSATEKLRWADLRARPLAEITDPPLRGGAYRMKVTLPQRSGRQLLYVVWETSDTPDTYYSCSDLVFPAALASASASPPPPPAPSAPSAPAAASFTATPAVTVVATDRDGTVTLGYRLILGALTVVALVIAGAGVQRVRRRRRL